MHLSVVVTDVIDENKCTIGDEDTNSAKESANKMRRLFIVIDVINKNKWVIVMRC
jgi:hypothetical protein